MDADLAILPPVIVHDPALGAAQFKVPVGQLADWNFELRGAQSWVMDDDRWQYGQVSVHMPDGEYKFDI